MNFDIDLKDHEHNLMFVSLGIAKSRFVKLHQAVIDIVEEEHAKEEVTGYFSSAVCIERLSEWCESKEELVLVAYMMGVYFAEVHHITYEGLLPILEHSN